MNLDDTNPIADFTTAVRLHRQLAKGRFPGAVDFDGSGIEDLEVIEAKCDSGAAGFNCCPNLGEARGICHGHVDFSHSGNSSLGDAKITATDRWGNAADFIPPICSAPGDYNQTSSPDPPPKAAGQRHFFPRAPLSIPPPLRSVPSSRFA